MLLRLCAQGQDQSQGDRGQGHSRTQKTRSPVVARLADHTGCH